jgi:hypothetical protein
LVVVVVVTLAFWPDAVAEVAFTPVELVSLEVVASAGAAWSLVDGALLIEPDMVEPEVLGALLMLPEEPEVVSDGEVVELDWA